MENSKNTLECIICLSDPTNPVATQCGHIFCWTCIKDWIKTKNENSCPTCKNGVNLNQVVRLFTGNETTDDNAKEIPKAERTNPTRTRNFANNFVI